MGDVIDISRMVKHLENPPNRIRELRKARRMSVHELAETIGTKGGVISRFETGERPVDLPWLQRIARGLGCKVAELLTYEDAPLYPRNTTERLAVEAVRADDRAADTIRRVAEAQLAYRGGPPPEEEDAQQLKRA